MFEPIRDFTASIDFFDIKMKDVISTLPPAVVVQSCLTSGQFCNLIQRDIMGFALGAAVRLRDGNQRQHRRLSAPSGIDLAFNWASKLPDGWGSYSVVFNATILDKAERTDSGGRADTTALVTTEQPAACPRRSGVTSCAARGPRRGTWICR